MRSAVLLFVVTAALAWGQASGSEPKTQPAGAGNPTAAGQHAAASKGKADSGAAISPAKKVITIHGVCGDAGLGTPSNSAGSCSTAVTKADFDVFLESLRASGQRLPEDAPVELRRQIAQTYVETLTFEEAARKIGLEKSADFEAAMKGLRITLLAQMYRYHIQQEAKKSTPEEIEAYYKQNTANFEELTLTHIVLPAYNPMNLKDEEFHKKAEQTMQELRDRMAKGENADKLEKEGLERLGQKSSVPAALGPARRGQYSEEQEKQLFALQAGEATPVIKLPSALVAYRLVSKRMIPLEEANPEIRQTLAQQKIEKETKALAESVHADYDPEYFGAPKHAAAKAASPEGATKPGAAAPPK